MAIEKPPIGIITNDLLNPSFETVEPAVEVLRNYVKNPNADGSNSHWGGVVEGTTTQETVSSPIISSTPGDVWSSSVTITNPPGAPVGNIEFYGTVPTRGGYYGLIPPPYFESSLGPGETITVSQPGSITADGADGVRLYLKLPIGVILSEAIVTKTSETVPYFDGDYSPDPDLTPAWTGTPNESESILSYTPVTEVSGGWSSTDWAMSGNRSLRIPELEGIAGVTAVDVTEPTAWPHTVMSWRSVVAVGRYQPHPAEQRLISGVQGAILLIRYVRGASGTVISEGVSHGSIPPDVDWAYTASAPHEEINNWGLGRAATGDLRDWQGPMRAVAYDYPLTHEQARAVVGCLAARLSFTAIANTQRFSIHARNPGQQVFLDGELYHTTTTPDERVWVTDSGHVGLGAGWWDNGMVVREDYDGPYFDGDTPSFRYHGQVVSPQWMYGDPGFVKSRLGDYYEVQPWNPTAQWSKPENRRFTIGADRGMLYRDGLGVAWSGLVNVSRTGNDGDVGKRYIDGTLFNVSVPSSDYSATLEAFTYPDEFDACIGNLEHENTPGLTIHGQENQPFDLSYRTLQGDANGYGEEYTIHLVYNCMAVDSGSDHETINDSPEIGAFSFEIHGIPQIIPNAKPSAYFSINSRDVNRGLLARLEEILYGTDGSVPRIPTIEEIREFLNTE